MRTESGKHNKEMGPAFEPFIGIPTREKWALLKEELFATELKEPNEQPHGLDLVAQHFVAINPKTGMPEEILAPRKSFTDQCADHQRTVSRTVEIRK